MKKSAWPYLTFLICLLSCERNYDYVSLPATQPMRMLARPSSKTIGDFNMMEVVAEEAISKEEFVSSLAEEDSKEAFVSSPPGEQVAIARKLIKNGEITLTVSSVKKTRTQIDAVCSGLRAYISRDDQRDFGNKLQHSLVIRVPSARYDSLIRKIEALASKVENKTTTLQDVTEEFIDVEARLRTKKELSARYHEILKKARTVNEILAVENHIGNVQAELESMAGRLKYLNDQVSFSTLNLVYSEEIGIDFGYSSKFVGGIRNGWDSLISFTVGLISLWPLVIVFMSASWLFIRWRRKKKLSRQAAESSAAVPSA